MLRTLFLIAMMTLIGCDGKSNEIKLLSQNNQHMFYLYPDAKSAELYTGMSLINEYKLVIAKQTYNLQQTSGNKAKLKLKLNPKTGNWFCKGCKANGYSSTWIQQ